MLRYKATGHQTGGKQEKQKGGQTLGCHFLNYLA
jgi:hypothetical protein